MNVEWFGVVVAVVIGFLTAVPAWVALRPLPKSRVQYLVTNVQQLVNVPAGVQIRVSIGEQVVTEAFSMEVRVVNTGQSSLPTDVWESPLIIELEPGATLLSVSQIGSTPSGLRVNLSAETSRVVIKPFLLNTGDLVSFLLVCEGRSLGTATAHARIRDVQSLKRRKAPYPPGNGLDGALDESNKFVYFVIFPVMSIAFVLLAALSDIHPISNRLSFVAVVVALCGVAYPLWLRAAVKTSQRWRALEHLSFIPTEKLSHNESRDASTGENRYRTIRPADQQPVGGATTIPELDEETDLQLSTVDSQIDSDLRESSLLSTQVSAGKDARIFSIPAGVMRDAETILKLAGGDMTFFDRVTGELLAVAQLHSNCWFVSLPDGRTLGEFAVQAEALEAVRRYFAPSLSESHSPT